MPQVLALGIGRYAAPQVIGECWKWKAWRRKNLQSGIRLAPLLERKIALGIKQGLLDDGAASSVAPP